MKPHKYDYDSSWYVKEHLADVLVDLDQIKILVNQLEENVERACRGTIMGCRAARTDLRNLRKIIDLHARMDGQLLESLKFLKKEKLPRNKLGLISRQRRDKHGRWIDENTQWSDVWESNPRNKNK